MNIIAHLSSREWYARNPLATIRCAKCEREIDRRQWTTITSQRMPVCSTCTAPAWLRDLAGILNEAKPELPRYAPGIIIDVEQPLVYGTPVEPLMWGSRRVNFAHHIKDSVETGIGPADGRSRWALVPQETAWREMSALDRIVREHIGAKPFVPPPPAPPIPPTEQELEALRQHNLMQRAALAIDGGYDANAVHLTREARAAILLGLIGELAKAGKDKDAHS